MRARHLNGLSNNPLQTVLEHGPVDGFEDVSANLDHKIRSNPKNMSIECRVVQLAEGESVRHDRFAMWMAVGKDVRRVQQLVVCEPTDRASGLVCQEHSASKRPLVHPLNC